ncbi:MAG: serine hydrolase [Clostridiales bacterium]|nr:serine hydrolase [Clostridiales bacterium]
MHRISVITVLLFTVSHLFTWKATAGITALTDNPECVRWVDSVYNTLTPRQRVAQLFCPVVDPSKGETSKAVIKRYVGQNEVGGLLFRSGSIANYVNMTNYAQSLARIPVMMTLDGEWGLSMRVSDTPKFPYNMTLGAISDTRLLEEYGAEVARECKEMGLHVDFAPVADVNLNPANPVIGRRSFGEDPARVAAAVVAFGRGMEMNGVLTTAKHFPGHGDTSVDSHKSVPVIAHSAQHMHDTDLYPFQRYIDAGLSGIMVGHLSVPSLDDTGTQASMSYEITTRLLQQQMGFKGLVFTDALEMKGASADNNCVAAFKAGADMLLSSLNPPSDITALLKACEEGSIDSNEVERRCRKVLAYKWALGLRGRQAPLDINGMKGRLNTAHAKGLIERLTAASVTVTGNLSSILPAKPGKSVALVNIGSSSSAMGDVMLRHSDVKIYNTETPLTAAQLAEIAGHDIVVAAVYNDKATSIKTLSSLDKMSDHLVPVMFMTPYKAMKFKSTLSQSAAMMMMYDDNATARRVAGDAIFAGNTVSGRLPVSMPGVANLGEGVSYQATRLSFSTPHAAGMPEWLTDSIDAIARPAVTRGAFPGLQVMVVKDGHVVADLCYGNVSNVATSAPVTHSTLFDLASVSKAIGTLPGIMLATQRGMLDLNAPIGQYIKQLAGTDKAALTACDLLLHESGMPAGLDMYRIMTDPASYSGPLTRRRRAAPYTIRIARNTYGNSNAKLRRDITSPSPTSQFDKEIAKGIWVGKVTLDTLMQRIYDQPLRSRTTRYSCLNFCLLAQIESNVTGHGHDVWVKENIFDPIDAYTLTYRPLEKFTSTHIAATENDAFLRRQTIQGYAHDELAAFSGGVQGNAGLFGSATDVAKVCQMYLNRGEYAGERLLSRDIVELFTTTQSTQSRRGLGFDKPDVNDPDRSPVPEEVPGSAYGHTGFTGTCFWVDPDNRLIYVFLSNRINPSRENAAWNRNKARSRIHALLYKAIDSI